MLNLYSKEVVLQITLVGRVVRVSETATNLDLLIDDGTGTLEAKLYVDSEEEQNVRHQQSVAIKFHKCLAQYFFPVPVRWLIIAQS